MKLLIAGGAILRVDEIIKTIVDLSGGPNCKIGIIPLASESPYETWENHRNCFKRFNANPILIDVTSENYKVNAFSSEIANLILNLDGIFFTGGVQERIIRGLIIDGKDTPVLTSIKQLFSNGKLVAGSSAGAAIMSNPMIYEGVDMNVKVGVGLGFLMNGKLIVDQHFLQRGRLTRLFEAMLNTGVKIGIGIDEETAIKFEDFVGEVIGRSAVITLKMEDKNRFRLSYLSRGDIIKLDNLEINVHEKKKVLEKIDKSDRNKEYVFDVLTPHGFRNALKKLYEGGNMILEALIIRIVNDKDYEKIGYAYKLTFERDSKTLFYSEDGESISSAINVNVHFERKNIKMIFEDKI